MPLLFGDAEAGYASLDEARLALGGLMSLYNMVNASVNADAAVLPADCVFRDVLAILNEDSPAQWSRGFMHGHQAVIEQVPRRVAKTGRNDPSPCGTGGGESAGSRSESIESSGLIR